MSIGEKLSSFFGMKKALNDEFFDSLADILIEGDFPAQDAFKTVEDLRVLCRKEHITDAELARSRLAAILSGILDEAKTQDAGANSAVPGVILLLGVNGVGKTTSAAKLAAYYRKQQENPLLAAADTFRAAAIEQLKIHGERLGIRVVAGMHGGDSAACVFDAVSAAHSGGYKPVIVDTAGRMHTKSALVDELKKIARVIERASADKGGSGSFAAQEKYLVLDATTGSNAIVQAETFCEAVKPDGVILTKCDSTAKGGVVFPLASRLRLPVLYTCFGERYEDIALFDGVGYVRRFLGMEQPL
ncbi:MAG: signal recognition particle-docking protein FtsY [Spirochaetaceae bacterium]|jgi:fused signal recognition particle receptor|nr:signal recognition particle-docking protein FtsY [Spirochaetaceae bacterium]